MKYGYARVSTQGQDTGFEDQIRELNEYGCRRIHSEKVSSFAERQVLNELMEQLVHGDILVVTKLDRLARSVRNLLDLLDQLERKGVSLIILSMGGQLVDTKTPMGRFMLNVMGSVAELERGLTLERQRAGIKKAQLEGKYKGRSPKARQQIEQIRSMRAEGMSAAHIAKALEINRGTVHRLLKAA